MSGLLTRGFAQLCRKQIDFVNDDIRAVLVDKDDVGEAITGATNATPIVITSTSHGYSNGDLVTISGVLGNTAANGKFRVANVAANTYELTDPYDGANVAGNGAYTSGGRAINLSALQDLADIPAGARVATSPALTTTVSDAGQLDVADFTFSSVSGDPSEAVVYYTNTPAAEADKTLIFVDDSDTVTPDGNNIDVTHGAYLVRA